LAVPSRVAKPLPEQHPAADEFFRLHGIREQLMRADIAPGATLPDYELADHTDRPRKLSLLQGDDPMVLTLNRGVYCPKDRMQLLELARFSKQCAVGYTRLVTITTDSLILSNDLRLGVGADWTFLHDTERIVQKDLDIAEYTDPHNNPMIPHTFVLEPGLKIHKIYNGYWYWGRPAPAELHEDLRDVSRRIRPDWKIDTPQMREKWQRGDRKSFFPYGKSLRQVFVRMSNAVDQFE
jgi:peroxiredoxin